MYRRGRLEEMGILHHKNLTLCSGDVTDFGSIENIIRANRPDIVINCAASSHVGESFHTPVANLDITGKGCANILEAIRVNKSKEYNPQFVQFSSSEMMGSNCSIRNNDGTLTHYTGETTAAINFSKCFQNEETPLSANSPYAAAKIYAHNMTELYRRAYGMNCISFIMFNSESEYRGENFVTRKITKYVGQLAAKKVTEKLRLGNMNAMRDWTYAHDSINALSLLLELGATGPYVICSNQTHTVGHFAKLAFDLIGEKADDHIVVDPAFFRPCEVPFLKGDSSKIRALGWTPNVNIDGLARIMVSKDIERYKRAIY